MTEHILKVSRLEALTDGIFAIAMTILVLGLRLPEGVLVSHLSDVLMNDIAIRLFVYIGSFIILGTLWIAMNFQMGLLERVVRPYLWAHIFYLMMVCIVPFSASLVASYPDNKSSITFFAINLLCAYAGQLIICQSAYKRQINKSIYNETIHHAILKRIFVAPIFYIASIIVAKWNTTLAFLLLVSPPLLYLIPGQIDTLDK